MVNERNYTVGSSPYDNAYGLMYDNGDYSLEPQDDLPNILSENDKYHTIMDGETLQSISYDYYGDSGLWYRIANANNILNPLSDGELRVGLRLRIPIYGIS